MKESRFLTKGDIPPQGILLTIQDCYQDNLAMEGQPAQLEWCLSFQEEGSKPMVVKSVNRQLIAGFTGEAYTEKWVGQKIVVYVDPSVTMKGKVVGGLRVRQPRISKAAAAPARIVAPAPAPAPALPPAAEHALDEAGIGEDEVPF